MIKSILSHLKELSQINNSLIFVLDRAGHILHTASPSEEKPDVERYSWLTPMLEGVDAFTVLKSPESRRFWVLPLEGHFIVSLEQFPSDRADALKHVFMQALPYIAKVTGGEAVLFDNVGKRIASIDSDGKQVAERLVYSQLAKQAMETMSPVFGPSVMDQKHVAVRIPVIPEFGIGFSNYAVKYKKSDNSNFDSIIGESPVMHRCKELAGKIARSDSTTVIYGETGTGKELFVNAIHNESARRGKPFIAVNCGGIPENLIDSIFFGYEGGAFTGARKEGHQGVFEQANGGSLLLDEIGEMSLALQSHFLRVLQESEIVRVGGKKRIPIDVRIFAATNKNLDELVRQGLFRQDLYFRLHVLDICLPPLRERLEDIPLLADSMISKLHSKLKTCSGISTEALRILMRYEWPGNVRELGNVIERAMNMADGSVIQPQDLPEYIFRQTAEVNLKDISRSGERETISAVLASVGGNRKLVAEKLGISTTTLWRKMKELGIK